MPDISKKRRAQWLRDLARIYGQRRFPEERRFFIKFDAWHILDFAVIRQAFPGVPWIFLYREPVEILVSQLTKVSGRMLLGPLTAAFLQMPLLEALQTAQEEFCARALGQIAAAAVEAVERDPLGRLINYSELPGAMETVIVPWFGVDLSDINREAMRRAARYHAKSPGRLLFQPDSARKQRSANAKLRGMAQRWVGQAYARLEELRRSQERR